MFVWYLVGDDEKGEDDESGCTISERAVHALCHYSLRCYFQVGKTYVLLLGSRQGFTTVMGDLPFC